MQGVVKWFNATKGFWFIAPNEGGTDVFVHITALDGLRVDEGDIVAFDLQDGRKGKEAVNLSMVTKNPNPPMRRSFNQGWDRGGFSGWDRGSFNRAPRHHDDENDHDAD